MDTGYLDKMTEHVPTQREIYAKHLPIVQADIVRLEADMRNIKAELDTLRAYEIMYFNVVHGQVDHE